MTFGSRRRALCTALLLSFVAVTTLATLALAKPDASRLQTGAIEIKAVPIDNFSKSGRGPAQIGKLHFRGGLVLSSDNRDFGGWSGLTIDAEGRRILAISDAGAWLTAEIDYEGSRPTGLGDARIGPILAQGGKRLTRERDRDAESIRLVDGTLKHGTALVSFERNQRIGRLPVDDRGLGAPIGYLKMPAEARRMTTNKGIEAIGVILAGRYKGSLYAFSERLYDAKRNHTGWIWIKGEPKPVNLTNIDDFDITDTIGLPDGSILVLERRYRFFDGVRMRLRHVAAAEIEPGRTMVGDVLIAADNGQQIDNMEGLAAHRNAAGETILTLISDNNFNEYMQRTILLQFKLDLAVAAR